MLCISLYMRILTIKGILFYNLKSTCRPMIPVPRSSYRNQRWHQAQLHQDHLVITSNGKQKQVCTCLTPRHLAYLPYLLFSMLDQQIPVGACFSFCLSIWHSALLLWLKGHSKVCDQDETCLARTKPRLTFRIAVVYSILFHKGDAHAVQQNINQKKKSALLCFFPICFYW